MPRHEADSIEWIDYVPQETLFWRKRAWDVAGGIDPSFQFALDWDLLARFHQAGCRIVRLPYFLGCFRVHPQQKTSQVIHTTGAEEMARIRLRFHGGREGQHGCHRAPRPQDPIPGRPYGQAPRGRNPVVGACFFDPTSEV